MNFKYYSATGLLSIFLDLATVFLKPRILVFVFQKVKLANKQGMASSIMLHVSVLNLKVKIDAPALR